MTITLAPREQKAAFDVITRHFVPAVAGPIREAIIASRRLSSEQLEMIREAFTSEEPAMTDYDNVVALRVLFARFTDVSSD